MRAKYCDNRCDIDMFKDKENASNAWRGIMSSIDVVRKGISMAVGNGGKTFFWHHRWATKRPLVELVTSEPPLHLQDITVQEMWDSNLGWKTELFAEYLPEETLGEIASFDLIEDDEAIDDIFWNGSPSGGFSINSALNIIRNEEVVEEGEETRWKSIWKAPTPQKMRFFMWLANKERLMTNKNRFIRNIADDPRCMVCGAAEETAEHVVRLCLAAKSVWQKLGVLNIQFQDTMMFSDWILKNIEEGTAIRGSEWPREFVVTCWWLWRWRNEKSFNSTPSIPLDQASFLFARIGEIKRAVERADSMLIASNVRKQEVYIKWKYPKEGWVKLNTDGAAKGNPGKAGAGGLIRDTGVRYMKYML